MSYINLIFKKLNIIVVIILHIIAYILRSKKFNFSKFLHNGDYLKYSYIFYINYDVL